MFPEPGCADCGVGAPCASCGPAYPACGGACGGCCWDCNRACHFWADFELLLWWRRGRDFPPLVTTSPLGTPAGNAGVLGMPGTLTLFGDDSTGDNARTGGRVALGKWLDMHRIWGVQVRYFALDDAPVRFSADEGTTPILARPFFNVATGMADSQLVAFPGLFSGSIDIESRAELTGGDVTFRRLIGRTPCWRFDLLGGYVVSRIDEDLAIRSSSTVIDSGSIEFGTRIDVADVFDAQNEFHGGQIGFQAEYEGSCWRVKLLGSVALGNMNQQVRIGGETITTTPQDPPVVRAGGLLAQPTNSGIFERDEFAVMPELGIQFAYRLHPCIDLTMGYSFLYWSRVARAGDQIDLLVNPTQDEGELEGAPKPEFFFEDSAYWVHGLNFGLQCRF